MLHAPRRLARSLAVALVAVSSTAFVACGEDEAGSSTAPTEDPASTGGSVDTDPAKGEFSVTHILIAWKGAMRSKAERPKETAKDLAESLLRDIQGGRSFDEVWLKFTDEPKKPGAEHPIAMSVPLTGPSNFVPEFTDAARALKPGTISPTPAETAFGYHLIKRAP